MIRPRTIGSRLTHRQTSDLVLSSGSVAGASPDDDARRGGSDDGRLDQRGDAGSDGPNRGRRGSDRATDAASFRDRRPSFRVRALAEGRCRVDPSE